MDMTRVAIPAVLTAFLLVSCANKPAAGNQHATVLLRDGTSVSGMVLSSSPSQVEISGDDKITRTIPISQVQSIQYDGTATTASQTQPAVPAPVPSEP
ncbi:MAG: hypothetical protein JOZ22_26710, partial [Acidobacteriia bacterium]|nr:hypothetical protein [Terriglobia bacterium]